MVSSGGDLGTGSGGVAFAASIVHGGSETVGSAGLDAGASLSSGGGTYWQAAPRRQPDRMAAAARLNATGRQALAAMVQSGPAGLDGILCPGQRAAHAEPAHREILRGNPEGIPHLSPHFNAPGDFAAVEPAPAHVRAKRSFAAQDTEVRR